MPFVARTLPLVVSKPIIQVAFVAIYADYLRYTGVQHGGFTASGTEASNKRENDERCK